MHIEQPLVTVIMPVKNGKDFVEDAITSLINQDYKQLEILAIDDGSTDGTSNLINKFKDDRIKLISSNIPGSGIVTALNTGLSNAAGEFIVRMDADDICEVDRISRLVAKMVKFPNLTVCGSQGKKFGLSSGKLRVPISQQHIKSFTIFHSPFIHPSTIIRKSALLELGKQYEMGYELAEDYRLWTQLMMMGQGLNIRKQLLNYRVHQSQHSVSNLNIRKQSLLKIQTEWLESFGIVLSKQDQIVHTEMVTDVSFVARNPRVLKIAVRSYRNLFKANWQLQPSPFSKWWLMIDIVTTLFNQILYTFAVKLKMRSINEN